jgi:hypothetical protein
MAVAILFLDWIGYQTIVWQLSWTISYRKEENLYFLIGPAKQSRYLRLVLLVLPS